MELRAGATRPSHRERAQRPETVRRPTKPRQSRRREQHERAYEHDHESSEGSDSGTNFDDILKIADRALGEAKKQGRDRVVTAAPEPQSA